MWRIFGRHAREFGRAIRRQEYERTAEGIYFPRQRALVSGHVKVERNGGTIEQSNRLCDEFLYLLDASTWVQSGGTAALLAAPWWDGSFYVVPWGNNITPDSAYELANGLDSWILYKKLGELGDPGTGYPATTEGYSQTTRPAWVYANAGAGLIDNSASPAAFTMKTASTIDVYGFALISDAPGKQFGRPYTGVGDVGGGAPGFVTVDITAATDGTITYDNTDRYGRTIQIGTAFVNPVDGNSTNGWIDPGSDDYYDSGAGTWIDPGGDAISILPVPTGAASVVPSFAIVRLTGAPLTFVDNDPMNITWGIQLS